MQALRVGLAAGGRQAVVSGMGLWSRCSFVRGQVRMAARPSGATPVWPVVWSAPPSPLFGVPVRALAFG
jgi:hypothetical protein